MFFVGSKKNLGPSSMFLHLIPSGVVLLTLLSLTFLGWHNANESLNQERDVTTANYASHTKNTIRERLNTYEVVLKGASGLFIASSDVNRAEWKSYVDSFDLSQKYPGIQGVGYAVFVPADQLSAVVERARQEGVSNFRIYPEGQRSVYSTALFFEPLRDPSALGFDMFTEPIRREAMMWAQASGTTTLTRKLNFVVAGDSGQAGFTMYSPVYTDVIQYSLPPASRKVVGFTFAPFTGSNLFRDILDDGAKDKYAVRISDSSGGQDSILYQTERFASLDSSESHAYQLPMEVYGRRWLLDFRFSPDVIAETTRNRPLSSLISGIILSILLAGFVLILLVARTRTLSHAKHSEVQDAKDELLSLASHQLRTPATAVKQYIGMLRQGFVGEMNQDQHKLLDKAWDSNERQLHIINDLLYVAKIDANGIVLTPRRLEISKLVREVVQELSASANDRDNRIRLQLPIRKVYAEADEHCLRMAVENLISNAIKYSYKSTEITIKVVSKKHEVQIIVKDKGVGISPDEIPLLFQRFSRIPNELSKQISGSGIGLYLSQQLIQLHNGRIEVESEKGKGSTFTIFLPKKAVT